MSMDAATKKKIIDEYATSDGDTGSPRFRSPSAPGGSRTSPSTSRSTSTITTAGVA